MARIGEDEVTRKKERVEFESVNSMRKELGMPLLQKGWVTCISDCGDEFFTFDTKGNRMCETCRNKPRNNSYHDFQDAYSIVGA